MIRLIPVLLLAVFLSGCSKESGQQGGSPMPDRAISIRSSVHAADETKSAMNETSALTGAKFLLLHTEGSSAPSAMTGASLYTGDRAGDATGAVTWESGEGKPLYDKNNKYAWMQAYWPGTATLSNDGNTFSWPIDGKTDILLSNIWGAGRYTSPKTGSEGDPMTFEHLLMQIEVICKAESGVSIDVVRHVWGDITRIELVNTPASASYSLGASVPVFSDTRTTTELLKSDYQDAFAAVSVPVSSNATVTAAGMFAPQTPTSAGSFQLRIYTSTGGTQLITVQLTDDDGNLMPYEAGKRHTVTLSFKASDKAITVQNTIITPWSTGYAGDGGLDMPVPSTVASVGDYAYDNGTFYPTLLQGRVPIGVVYWLDDTDPDYKAPSGDTPAKGPKGLIVSLDEPVAGWNGGSNTIETLKWSNTTFNVGTGAYIAIREESAASTSGVARQNGAANRAVLQKFIDDTDYTINDFPAFKWCDSKNTAGQSDWYLPALSELQYLFCAYWGVAPRVWAGGTSGAAPTAAASGYPEAWNERFTAANVGGTAFVGTYYWSSSERDDINSWYVHFSNINTTSANKSNSNRVRCVRVFGN